MFTIPFALSVKMSKVFRSQLNLLHRCLNRDVKSTRISSGAGTSKIGDFFSAALLQKIDGGSD